MCFPRCGFYAQFGNFVTCAMLQADYKCFLITAVHDYSIKVERSFEPTNPVSQHTKYYTIESLNAATVSHQHKKHQTVV